MCSLKDTARGVEIVDPESYTGLLACFSHLRFVKQKKNTRQSPSGVMTRL